MIDKNDTPTCCAANFNTAKKGADSGILILEYYDKKIKKPTFCREV